MGTCEVCWGVSGERRSLTPLAEVPVAGPPDEVPPGPCGLLIQPDVERHDMLVRVQ